ncbi:hypothetical protein KDA_60990 [Dictyobacter alpinus]|uniref:DUF4349 domain-containing protein n=1 Tax=Dictyobacter alpinus TaxID=2014873 RepID=A0A402BGV8_9CHLR|nr:DUF4349 domain-containing protein [Dictyobacter alpinus]GCE30615.1 hypothetical protein KDA_60990 [Dictyobacter alpinus]
MEHTRMSLHKASLFITSFLLLAIFLVACGSAASNSGTSTTTRAPYRPSSSGGNTNSQASTANNQPGAAKSNSANSQSDAGSAQGGPQYLIKTLNVTMQVKDTRKVASDIQTWIGATDPRSSSAGGEYTQVADNFYNVSLTFSVQASMYTQVYNHLRDYNLQGATGGKLVAFKETVQDVSNDYVDTQSRIKNYKVEQSRLLELLSHAQSVGDIVTVDQKLSEVEGNIENAEAHLKLLSSQVTYYTVVVSLQPIIPGVVTQPATTPGWTASSVFSDAFAASLHFGQAILTFLIWLLAFCIYIVPIAIITWLVRRYRSRIASVLQPLKATISASPPPPQS